MFLREYIYVDIDKVNGLISQLENGVPQTATQIQDRRKRLELNLQAIKGGRSSSAQEHVEKSLSDSLFAELEMSLESLGVLQDISEEVMTPVSIQSGRDAIAPGRIVRITAPGTIFHAEQLSTALVGLATAAQGLSELDDESHGDDSPTLPPKAKQTTQKKAERAARSPMADPLFPEDFLPKTDYFPLIGSSRTQLSGMIKVVRSIFGEGVHLHLRPAGPDGLVISARLEAGRRFLDSSPEVILSRYGLLEQEWTVVGIAGTQGATPGNFEDIGEVFNDDTGINRAKFVHLVATFLGHASGLVDLPQHPGFSIIPLALYRTIGEIDA